jgi:hypothetical protein
MVGSRFRSRPALRLPLDPRSARRAPRYLWCEPWSSVARLILILVGTGLNAWSPSTLGRPVSLAGGFALLAWSLPYVNGVLPRQWPHRTAEGDLRIPDVPIEVAERWVQLNPGIVPTRRPAPAPRPRRRHATWATILLAAATVLFAVLAFDGHEDSGLAWLGLLVLFIAGGTAAVRTLPPGFIRIDNGDQ